MNPATPQPQLDNNSSAALLAFPNRTEATAILGARPSEAKLEAEASTRAGMSAPHTVLTAILQATAVASSTAVGADEAMPNEGLEATLEAASGLTGRPI